MEHGSKAFLLEAATVESVQNKKDSRIQKSLCFEVYFFH